MKLLINIFFLFSFLSLISCISDEEKLSRQNNAFDLEGDYKTEADNNQDNDVQLEIKIINETNRSNIKAEVKRSTELTEKEKHFLKQVNISEKWIKDNFVSKELLIFGKGENNTLSGGENISSNFGGRSEVDICTEAVEYNNGNNKDKEKYEKIEVQYCISAEINQKDYRLKGQLYIFATKEQRKKIKDEKGKESEQINREYFIQGYSIENQDGKNVSTERLNFIALTDKKFYEQYFGRWILDQKDVYIKNNYDFIKKINGIEVKYSNENSKEKVVVSFLDLYQDKITEIQFNDKTFQIKSEAYDVFSAFENNYNEEELNDKFEKFPFVKVIFIEKNDGNDGQGQNKILEQIEFSLIFQNFYAETGGLGVFVEKINFNTDKIDSIAYLMFSKSL